MVITPNKVSYKILKWMQAHDGQLKNTTGQIIAEKIAALPDIENGELTIKQTLSRMVKANVVYRDKIDGSFFSDFRINYWHKNIPADILADAPVEVKRAMAKSIDDMQDNQYMDDEGCIVTPNSVEKVEDPFNEGGSEEGTFENPIKDEVSPWEEGYEEEKSKEISVPVEVKKDGKTMSITVNLTINL
jgi:hypothetical protein